VPRYIVERTYNELWDIGTDEFGAEKCRNVVERNLDLGVTWLMSYVSLDKTRSYCVYDAPHPEAIRKTAARNALPVDSITQVTVFDPYFCR
jgi:hypothetical protein